MKRIALFVGMSTPALALAMGGGEAGATAGGSSGADVFFLIVFVGLAYLLAHFVVNRLQRRFLFLSGFEYILIGALLGPALVDTISVFDNLGRLAPIIAFAAGWIALMYGMEFKFRALLDAEEASFRLAFVDVFGTGGLVGLAAFAFFRSGWLMPPVDLPEAGCTAFMLATAAAAGSSSAVDLMNEAYPDLPSRLLPLLRQATRLGDMLAILALGLLFCIWRGEPNQPIDFAPDPSAWILGTGALGLGLGVVFALFLGKEASANSRFLALLGITVFAAGSSFFLGVSALTVNLLLGFVLVNSADGPEVVATLESSLRPITLVLMVFAGAMWVPVAWGPAVALTVGFFVVRTLAKALSLSIGTLGTSLRPGLFWGMLAQGDVTVAIAVSFRLVFHGPATDLAYTAVLASVMLHQLAAPRLLKKLLIDAGELDSDVPLRRNPIT